MLAILIITQQFITYIVELAIWRHIGTMWAGRQQAALHSVAEYQLRENKLIFLPPERSLEYYVSLSLPCDSWLVPINFAAQILSFSDFSKLYF